MWLYYAALILTIAASVLYHFIQKSTPADVNPIISISVSYVTALALCAVSYPFFSNVGELAPSLAKLNWTSYALGAAIFGIEIGFLLAYRAGWDISLANIISAVSVTLVLILLGVAVFHEKLSGINIIGIILCIAGIIFIRH